MTAIGLTALLLERLLRLFDLFAGPEDVLRNVGRMVVLLAPHYLGIALPAAFFFGVLLTFRRLNRENELPALLASGSGLPRLLRAPAGMAVVMAVIVAILIGYLQPYARYAYRTIKHSVAEASLGAAVQEGAFIKAGGMTFFAETAAQDGDALALTRVFVLQEEPDGSSQATTARQGFLLPSRDGEATLLRLRDGRRTIYQEDGNQQTVTFDELTWPVDTGNATRYRPRGRDRRELTLPELFVALANPPPEPSRAELIAEINTRLTMIASTLVLPLLAAALAVRRNPRGRDYSIWIGLLLLVIYQKALDFGDGMVKREIAGPLLGLWLPFAVLLVVTLYLYRDAAYRVPSLGTARWYDAFRHRLRHLGTLLSPGRSSG